MRAPCMLHVQLDDRYNIDIRTHQTLTMAAFRNFLAVTLFLGVTLISARTPSEWRGRVIYQLFTDRFASTSANATANGCDLHSYCGGNYQGLIKHLDYIKSLGANAVWISPVVQNTPGGYHGYWMSDLYNVNDNFGTRDDLKAFVKAAHAMDIWVMVDVVANHVGDVDMDFSKITPFDDPEHYHNKCEITDFNNQPMVEQCRLSNLPDLNQTNGYVQSTLYDWVEGLVTDYGFDGVRIDTVPEVHIDFWPGFNAAANSFCMGEVFNGDINYVAPYQKNAVDSVLSYPLFFTLRNVFQNPSSSMTELEDTLMAYTQRFKDTTLLGTFVDNHDNARFLHTQSDKTLYKNALAFGLITDGIPIIYYGSEQSFSGGADPENRETLWTSNYDTSNELFSFINRTIAHRTAHTLWKEKQVQRYASNDFYAFSRGSTLLATTNVGSNGPDVSEDITYMPDGWVVGATICDALDANFQCVTLQTAKLTVNLIRGEPRLLYVRS